MKNKFKIYIGKITRKHIVIVLMVLIVLVLAIPIFHYYSPEKPTIKITSDSEFTGDSFIFSGLISADCRCKLTAKLNNEILDLDNDGGFSIDVQLDGGTDKWTYDLIAVANGRLINLSSINKEKSGSIKRTSAELVMSPNISEWSGESIEFHFSGFPGSTISVSALTSYYVYEPLDESSIELDTQDFTIDDTGLITISMPFENSDNNRSTTYKISSSLAGYAIYEKDYKINNLNFNEEKQVAAKAAWEEEQEKNRILGSMETYTGNGNIKIAVSKSIKISRTVGYRYVLDPDNYQFVSFVLFAKNTGYDSKYVSPNYVTVIDENKRTYNYDQATYTYGNYFDTVDLQSNTFSDGYLAFILPKSHHKFTVVYNDGSNIIEKEIYVD